MGTFKTVSEVVAALEKRYNGPTYKREGQGGKMFTYIPWYVSVRLLNDIFGVFGWSASEPVAVCAEGQWTVTLSLTARVVDEAGTLIEKTVPCVGSAAARDDNSAKAALSDALSKGVKFYGDAFGFYLSEEKGGGSSNGGSSSKPATSSSNGSGTGAASEKQAGMMRKNGWSDEAIRGLSREQVREVMDGLFDKGPRIDPPGKTKGDDIPF